MTSYQFIELSPALPDDDPSWRQWVDAIRLGFHESQTSDEHLKKLQGVVRADGWLREAALAPTPAIAPAPPITVGYAATFASTVKPLNAGGPELVDCTYITDVTVRHTDRRRGLLRTMMERALHRAKGDGVPLAALTASEGGIYGRFGFDVAIWAYGAEIYPAKWQLHTPATGRVENIARSQLRPYAHAVWEEQLRTQRGTLTRSAFNDLSLEGIDWESLTTDNKARALVHWNESGQVDGYATYAFSTWDPVPTITVGEVQATNPAAELALWDGLNHIDLVELIKAQPLGRPQLLSAAVTNPRAIKIVRQVDALWLRILDVPAALAKRGWDHDDAVRITVTDPLGLAAGTFEVRVENGRATVTQMPGGADNSGADNSGTGDGDLAHITLDAGALASIYFGAAGVQDLAAAGRISGELAALQRAHRLFAVYQQPRITADF